MNMDLAIFDLDGTLIDSMSVWKNVSGEFLREQGITPKEGLEEKVRTMSFAMSGAYIKKEYNLPHDVDDILKHWFSKVHHAYASTIGEKINTMNYLKYLKKNGVKMCIATASDLELAQKATKRLGIDDFMEFTITVEDIGVGKEKPDIFLYCADRLKVPVENSFVYEDSLHALQSAKRGGFYTVGVKDRENVSLWDEIKKEADVAVEELGQLMQTRSVVPGQ